MEHVSRNQYDLQFIVCDRPNPLGKTVKGSRFDPDFRSLVSYIDVPYQHGKTIGELLDGYNQTLEHPVRLTNISSLKTSQYLVESKIYSTKNVKKFMAMAAVDVACLSESS